MQREWSADLARRVMTQCMTIPSRDRRGIKFGDKHLNIWVVGNQHRIATTMVTVQVCIEHMAQGEVVPQCRIDQIQGLIGMRGITGIHQTRPLAVSKKNAV